MKLDYLNESIVEQSADQYFDKYRDQIEAFEKHSVLAKAGGSITASDVYALGRQLEQFEEYKSFVEQTGSVADLGTLPNIALDVITAAHGNSIMPLVASTQPINEEQGIIYFKQIAATNTSADRTKGQIIMDAEGGVRSFSDTYGASRIEGEVVVTGDGNTTDFTGNLNNVQIRPRTFNATVGGVKIIDDGEGRLLGNGAYGTINYETGVYEIKFAEAVAADAKVVSGYEVLLEAQDDLVGIAGSLTSTDIRAEVFALKSETGLLQEFSFQKRFGRLAQDEVAQDLTAELTRTTNTAAIKRLYAASRGVTTWDKTAPTAVSYAEHKLTFVDAFAQAEATLNANAGRGNISRIICGATAAATLRGMPGFTAAEGGMNHSVGLYGFYNGVPVIRAANVIPANEMLCIYKGLSHFEAPLVHAPYMPLFVSNTIPAGTNPMRNQRMAAVWTGLKSVIPTFVTKLQIVES